MTRILIVRLDHVGDCVSTVPAAAEAVKADYHDLKVELLTTSRSASILKYADHIDRIHVFDPPWSVLLGDKRRVSYWRYLSDTSTFFLKTKQGKFGKFDTLFHFSLSPPEKVVCSSLAKVRCGFDGPYSGFKHSLSQGFLTYRTAFDVSQHVLRNCLNLIHTQYPLTSRVACSTLRLPDSVNLLGRRLLRQVGAPVKPLLIHPGGHGSMKNWPLPRFAELCRAVSNRYTEPCVVVGGPVQKRSVEDVVTAAGTQHAVPLITEDFESFLAVASLSRICICNDGGPAHTAAAAGTPIVVIFGPTDPSLFAPLGKEVRIVSAPQGPSGYIYPWSRRGQSAAASSLLSISVEEVFNAVTGLLGTV